MCLYKFVAVLLYLEWSRSKVNDLQREWIMWSKTSGLIPVLFCFFKQKLLKFISWKLFPYFPNWQCWWNCSSIAVNGEFRNYQNTVSSSPQMFQNWIQRSINAKWVFIKCFKLALHHKQIISYIPYTNFHTFLMNKNVIICVLTGLERHDGE